jgi:hypothetical protein
MYINSRFRLRREEVVLRPKAGDRNRHREQYQE